MRSKGSAPQRPLKKVNVTNEAVNLLKTKTHDFPIRLKAVNLLKMLRLDY